MRTYVLRRLLQTIPLLLGISLMTFLLLQLAPGDFLNQMAENPGISAETIEAMRVRFGLDKPWYVQYGIYLRNVIFNFDFGQSFSRHQGSPASAPASCWHVGWASGACSRSPATTT